MCWMIQHVWLPIRSVDSEGSVQPPALCPLRPPPPMIDIICSLAITTYQVWDCAFSKDSGVLLTGSSDKQVLLQNVKDGQLIRQYRGHTKAVTAIALKEWSRWKGSYMRLCMCVCVCVCVCCARALLWLFLIYIKVIFVVIKSWTFWELGLPCVLIFHNVS